MDQKHSGFIFILVKTFFIFWGVVALTECEPSNPSGEPKRVVLFQYVDSPLHELAIGGIIEGLAAKGFTEGNSLELIRHNSLRNTETAADIAGEIASGDFDLILTTGTQALQAVSLANQSGVTTQVFGVVANPFGAGVGLDASDPTAHPTHLVGVGSSPPVGPVFEIAREINPELKVVGVIWNPGEINSAEGIARARAFTAKSGITLLDATAATPEEIDEAAKILVSQGAEILWIGPDNTVHHAADLIIETAREAGIPVMSSMPGDANRGALIDLSHDWHEVGRKVGAMAGDILAGADPSTIAISVHDENLRLVLNESARSGLSPAWTFPEDVSARAYEIIDTPN